jgi:hypothetical protein
VNLGESLAQDQLRLYNGQPGLPTTLELTPLSATIQSFLATTSPTDPPVVLQKEVLINKLKFTDPVDDKEVEMYVDYSWTVARTREHLAYFHNITTTELFIEANKLSDDSSLVTYFNPDSAASVIISTQSTAAPETKPVGGNDTVPVAPEAPVLPATPETPATPATPETPETPATPASKCVDAVTYTDQSMPPKTYDTCEYKGCRVVLGMAEQLVNLLDAAEAASVPLGCARSFRKPEEQIALRKQHCQGPDIDIMTAPSSACTPPTAIPGTTNHEKGLAIDLKCVGADKTFGESPCWPWMESNGNTHGWYNLPSEPWHWSKNGK